MVAALIVVGVILFLVVDGLILWKVLGSGSRAGRHGSVSVPGEATLSLPAGRVKLTYQESVHTRSGEGTLPFYPPSDLEITVRSAAGGEPLPLDRGRGSSGETVAGFMPGGPRSRTRVGALEVPAAGQYVVRATGSTADRVEPLLLIGA